MNEKLSSDFWDELLKPTEPLGDNEITLAMACEKMGVKYAKTALRRIRELEQTGAVVSVGPRKLPSGHTAEAWKLS